MREREDRRAVAGPDAGVRRHIALAYTREDRAVYPHVLQALLEYRTARGAARVMA